MSKISNVNMSYFLFLIVTIVSSVFAWQIIVKGYEVFDGNLGNIAQAIAQ